MPELCEDMRNKVGVDLHVALPSLPTALNLKTFHLYPERAGGVYSWEFFVGVCRPVLQILTLFQTKNMSFYRPVFRPDLQNPYLFEGGIGVY